jgi:hypothetical protein
MASTYSQLKIELIGLGEQDGTWGTTNNTNLGVAIEEAIAGRANPVMGDSNLTLTLADSNASQVARHYILNVTSSITLSTTRDLIVPAINKPYIIENNTTGTQSIVVKTASGTGVTVPNGKRMMVFVNGTNVVPAFNELPAGVTITGLGEVVGTTTTQTLTNKTINIANNTLTGVAPLASPALSGTPTAPTAAAATNTTQVATTAHVFAERTNTATLTNKTIAFGSNTLTDVASTNTAQTFTSKTLGNYTETVFAITDGTTVNLDPNNGPIQTWTLGANRTPGQANWAAGQSISLQIDDGSANTLNWTTLGVVWKTDSGFPPVLQTTGVTAIVLWKVGSVIYGARVGDA